MTFNEAVRHKKSILKNSSEFTRSLYDYIIIPAIEEEGKRYMDEFRKTHPLLSEESCKTYSSNARFKVLLSVKNNN